MTETTTAPAAAEQVEHNEGDEEKRTVVRTQGVKKIYKMGDIEVHALRGVDLEIYAGEYLSIMGPSGSGKSTFFNMVGGLDKPSEGKVYIDEVEMVAYDGLTGAVKFYNSDHSSNTMMDCPIIADVDADGHAEILVAHASLGGSALTAFGDRDDSWAPARKVWNQHAYTITNINDDLTVPTTATQNFTTFNSFKSAIDRLPGESLGWELESEISDVCEDDCDTGSVWVVAQILNKSEDDQAGGVNVTLYGLNGGDRIPLQTLQTSDVVPSGMSSEALLFEIDPVLLNDIDGFLLMADDDGSGTGFVSECNEDNNQARSNPISCPSS